MPSTERSMSGLGRHRLSRNYHTSRPAFEQLVAVETKSEPSNGIRAQLRQWQELYGREEAEAVELQSDPDNGDMINTVTRLGEEHIFRQTPEDEQDERETVQTFMHSVDDESGGNARPRGEFLRMGDLVELEYLRSDRESIVAIFIRHFGNMTQMYTMHGRWVHVMPRTVQYSITGWIDPALVRPLLDYLPAADEIANMRVLLKEAYIKDMSVPRHVAAPLVSRMLQFYSESKEIYRQHVGTLDNMHDILAHEDKLRFTDLPSMAAKLLNIPVSKLTLTAIYAVRQACSRAGFAFSIDRRSHRLTGHVTIRTKEQVRMAEKVKRWLRQWQDDLAARVTMSEDQLQKHNVPLSAQYVYSFIDKAKKIIEKSREDRTPTEFGSIGPSKVRLPITPESSCVRSIPGQEFTAQDQELVKFIEAWSLSGMFLGLPRVEALPPLLLQATGMYADLELKAHTGLIFLQELGTILPYENRVRFDPHLLLPQSEHSKPLQDLMTRVLHLHGRPGFQDSMASLRHDWKNLPVYCIDDASAHEIDDGLSVEPVGENEWWVHIHIANPTAFFSRDHDLAKMSQHMHESVYMPERAYMMLPRWATQAHFSLGKDRPCMTISARMNRQGNVLEKKIRSGLIRNVIRLTHEEVSKLLGVETDQQPELVLTVGGEPPPPRPRKSRVKDITPQQVQQLRVLSHLADRRQEIRRAAGGLFFDAHKPDVQVWESYRGSGLAWERPHRSGSRRIEGDPVIQMRTKGLVNWFAASNDVVGCLVREMMLLACETAATWCSERQIPIPYRGSVPNPDRMNSDQFFQEFLANHTSEYPMHLGLQYMHTFGMTQISTTPFRHKILGMDKYAKVTSPLRRYSDMIMHWQIDATLREEAKGPLTTDRSFLPFSQPVLQNLIKTMKPREVMIARAKMYSDDFWTSMLLFRAFHFGEAKLPGDTFKVYVHTSVESTMSFHSLGVIVMALNVSGSMERPQEQSKSMPEALVGDVWECELVSVDVRQRTPFFKPLRLLERGGSL